MLGKEDIIKERDELSFLKDILAYEETKLKCSLDELSKYSEVQNYISLLKNIRSYQKQGVYKDPIKATYEDNLDFLVDFYKEVKLYKETAKTLTDYQNYSKKLETFTSTEEGIIYNGKSEKPCKTYSIYDLLNHLMTLKQSNFQTTPEELSKYRDIVARNITSKKHYQDDEIIETFLGTKIYQNPENYAVEDIETGLAKFQTGSSTYKFENGIISLVSFNDSFIKSKSLSQREEHAFYSEEAYVLLKIDKDTKIKKIGVKKHE